MGPHPNIIGFFGYVEDGDRFGIVIEFANTSFLHYLRNVVKPQSFPEQTVISILHHVTLAMVKVLIKILICDELTSLEIAITVLYV